MISETTSLHRITQLPFNRDAEIFRHYAAFKLGVTAAVRHYAELLLPLVKRLVAESEHTGWIITSPGIVTHTPAGANSLCWEMFDLYSRERNSKELYLIDIQYDNEATASVDYAIVGFADRVTERERLTQRLVPNAEFQGRPILFINDVCVTGAQQQTMQQYFERVEAASVTWLYLIVVDPEIGTTKPDVEWEINYAPFEDLLRLVSREEIQFTGKCILKLMHLSTAELDQVLRALSSERRTRLLELALLNGFQTLECFQEQMELVGSYATENCPE